jgi:hypothetical protein
MEGLGYLMEYETLSIRGVKHETVIMYGINSVHRDTGQG